MKESFNEAYSFLLKHKSALQGRSYLSQTTKKWYELWRPREITAQTHKKLVCPKLCKQATFDIVDKNTFFLDTVYSIPIDHLKTYSPLFLLATLNSKITTFFLIKTCPPKANSYFSNEREFLSRIPIRHIAFTSESKYRAKMFEHGKELHKDYVRGKTHELILNYIEKLLSRHPAETDIVHDLIAYLALQMVEINKKMQKDVKQYLAWLEKALKIQSDNKGNIGIEALTGKSTIKSYLGDYQKNDEALSFEAFIKILHKNRLRIGVNLVDSKFAYTLKTEYDKSLSILLPLKERLKHTDWLIDQIVYKLYGLTEDEIKIVEGRG